MAIIIGGKHSRRCRKKLLNGSLFQQHSNRVLLKNEESGESFETIDDYVVNGGRESSAIDRWGFEE